MRSDRLYRHKKTHLPNKSCKYCKKEIRKDRLLRHELLCKDGVDERLCNRECERDSDVLPVPTSHSMNGLFKNYLLDVEDTMDYDAVLRNIVTATRSLLQKIVAVHPVKAQIVLNIKFHINTMGGTVENNYADAAFRSICEPLVMGDSLDGFLDRAVKYIRANISTFEEMGSGWQFHKLNTANVETARYRPLVK